MNQLKSITRLILVVLGLSIFTNCNFIIAKMLGIKNYNPKELSFEYQKQYLLNKQIDTSNLYILDNHLNDSMIYNTNYMMSLWDENGISVPQFRVYDKNGLLVSGWQQCFGNAKGMNVYSEFPPSYSQKMSSIILKDSKIDKIFSILKNEYGKTPNAKIILSEYDYVIVAFWASYLGSLSNSMLLSLDQYKERFREKNVLLMKVNLGDIQRKNN